jgi:hypothetical protein
VRTAAYDVWAYVVHFNKEIIERHAIRSSFKYSASHERLSSNISNKCWIGYFMPHRVVKRVCVSHVGTGTILYYCDRSEDSHECVTGEEPRGSSTSVVELRQRIPLQVVNLASVLSAESSVFFFFSFFF